MSMENLPFPLNTATTGGYIAETMYEPDLGKTYMGSGVTYVLLKAGTGGIASGSNGLSVALRLPTATCGVSGAPNFQVGLNVVDANPMVIGIITSGLTQAITSGQYFLAVYAGTVLATVASSGASSIVSGIGLVPNGSSQLRMAITGASWSGQQEAGNWSAGIAVGSITGANATQAIQVAFRAPYRLY